MRPLSPQADLGNSLSSWRNPSFLAPLGHLVSADAASGVIHRLIEPSAPPTTGPVGSPLEFATAAPRHPKGSVVQRVLAPITAWASRGSEPADTEPDRDQGTRAGPDPALPSAEPSTEISAPVPMPVPAHRPSVAGPAPVQRSVPVPAPVVAAPLTRAPAPQLPILELPVLPAGTFLAEAAAPDSAVTPPATEPAWSGDGPAGAADDHSGEVPTLGMVPPSSAHQPADGGAGEPADVTGQERRASAPAVETPGPPGNPVVQRAGPAEAPARPASQHVAPQPPVDSSSVGEVATLGTALPSAATRSMTGEPGTAADLAGPGPGGGTSGFRTPERPMTVVSAVQRAESAAPQAAAPEPVVPGNVVPEHVVPEPVVPEPVVPGNGVIEDAVPVPAVSEGAAPREAGRTEVPTLGAGPPSSVAALAHDVSPAGPPVQPITDPPGQQMTGSAVQRITGHGVLGPVVQRTAGPAVQRERAAEVGPAPPPVPSRPGAARRLGLGPPLAPDAVPVQLSQAPQMTSLPPGPASLPAGSDNQAATRTSGTTEQSPGPVGDVIAPLLGASGPPSRSAAAAPGPPAEAPAHAATTGPTVQMARDPSPSLVSSAGEVLPESAASAAPAPPPALLPVLRAQESTPPGTEPPTPALPTPALPTPAMLAPAPPTPALSAPAPAPSAPPVVARLIGDRTPSLLTAGLPGSARTQPGMRAVHDAPVQRAQAGPGARAAGPGGQQVPAQSPSSAPLRPAGYPAPAAPPLPVQFAPAPAQPAPARHTPAPFVQSVPAQPPEPVSTAPVALQAQEITLDPGGDPGADPPGEPDLPGQLAPPGPAGPADPGAPAAGAAAASPDELVKKLFDPLLRRLKTELRLDRERRGMLTDLHH